MSMAYSLFSAGPFSVYRAQKYVEIFYDVVGPGTQLLSLKKKGDTLDVLGPLGAPFMMPPAGTKQVVIDCRRHRHCPDAYPFRRA